MLESGFAGKGIYIVNSLMLSLCGYAGQVCTAQMIKVNIIILSMPISFVYFFHII